VLRLIGAVSKMLILSSWLRIRTSDAIDVVRASPRKYHHSPPLSPAYAEEAPNRGSTSTGRYCDTTCAAKSGRPSKIVEIQSGERDESANGADYQHRQVTMPGTRYSISYRKLHDTPSLVASDVRFRAQAWVAANDKARELGWIA
jgi:hypothetical protein